MEIRPELSLYRLCTSQEVEVNRYFYDSAIKRSCTVLCRGVPVKYRRNFR
jgi:hypothetical protein